MKISFLAFSVLSMAAALLFTGCVERHVYVSRPPAVVVQPAEVITQAPPAPLQEVYVASPGPEYLWQPGYWAWQGRWVWMSGHWAHRPHARAVWVQGHWVHRGHGYVWIGGAWR
jgi:WXXGXW repeat (2 copies)